MLIGGILFSAPVFICSFVKSFILFALLYSIILGFGFGFIYILPLKNAWLFYPNRKGMISGLILSCYSIGAIAWIFISTAIANPNNESPSLHIFVGENEEKLFEPYSTVAENVPFMLQVLSYIFIAMALLSTLLISKKDEALMPKK